MKAPAVLLFCLALVGCASAPPSQDAQITETWANMRALQQETDRFEARVNALSLPGKPAVASWYGPGFEGKPMANGQPFDKWALTCASRTIPRGTWVWLSNPATGKSCPALVTDCGPFVKGRDLDISYEVARRLRMVHTGVQVVEVREVR